VNAAPIVQAARDENGKVIATPQILAALLSDSALTGFSLVLGPGRVPSYRNDRRGISPLEADDLAILAKRLQSLFGMAPIGADMLSDAIVQVIES